MFTKKRVKAKKHDPEDKPLPIYGDGMNIRDWLYVEGYGCGKAPLAQVSLITYVKGRPDHDRRYVIDARKILSEQGYAPPESFETGIRKTIL